MADSAHNNNGLPMWTPADRFRKAREHAGLDQIELAELIGIARSSLSNYERGKATPRRPVILSWAMATGVSVEWLMGSECSCWRCQHENGPDDPTGQVIRTST